MGGENRGGGGWKEKEAEKLWPGCKRKLLQKKKKLKKERKILKTMTPWISVLSYCYVCDHPDPSQL